MRLFQCTQCLVLVYAMAGLKIDEYLRAMMDATAKELIEEKSLAKSCLSNNEDNLIKIHEKEKRSSSFLCNFMYNFYLSRISFISFGTMTEQDLSF